MPSLLGSSWKISLQLHIKDCFLLVLLRFTASKTMWGLTECNLLSVSIQHMYYISAMHPRTAAILFTALSKNGNIKSIFHLFEIFFNHRSISDVLLLEQNIWGVNVCNSKRLTGRNPQWWNYPRGVDKTFLLFLSQQKWDYVKLKKFGWANKAIKRK